MTSQLLGLTSWSIGQVLTTIPLPRVTTDFRERVREVVDRGRQVVVEVQIDDSDYQLQINPYYSEHNQVDGAVLIFTDSTEIRQKERALEQTKQRLETQVSERTGELTRANEELRLNASPLLTMLRNLRVMVFNHDTELRYALIFNPAPGFDAEAAIGRTDAELADTGHLSADDAETLTRLKREVLDTGRPVREGVQYTPRGGEPQLYHLMLVPFFDQEGHITGITGIALERTEGAD